MSEPNAGSCDQCKEFSEHRTSTKIGNDKEAQDFELCEKCYEKITDELPAVFHGDAKRIVRAAGQLAESYVAWAFEQGSSLRLGLLGDTVRERFRDYVKIAHPDLFQRMLAAEKKAHRPKLHIVGLKPAEAKPAEPTEGA